MSRSVASWPFDFDQALAGTEQKHDPGKRAMAIRSLRYHMVQAEDDIQLSRNIRILEVFSVLLSDCRQRFESFGSQSEGRDGMLAKIRSDPAIHAIGDVLRRVLAKPNPGIGCFDRPRAWCMDFLDLKKCNFPHAQLEQVSFYGTGLGQSGFTYANLEGADLTCVDLTGADLSHATISGTELSGANIAWADLSHAEMRGAFVNNANLSGTILDHAVLGQAFLSGANMIKASLTGADLRGANMFAIRISEAKLKNAILTGTGITKERIQRLGESVQWNAGTKWGCENDRDGRNPLNHCYY